MFPPATSPPRISTLVLLTALSVLTLNMFLPSLPHIAEAFGTDYAVVNLSVAGYLAVTALLQLIAGPLSDRFGRRPVALCALAVFVLASLGCALAGDVRVFLAFRFLQATVISGWTLSQAAIRDTTEPRQAASLMGYVAMAMAIAPAMGPMLGGFLDALFGWRANFYAFTGLGLAVFALCWTDFGETNRNPSQTLARQFHTWPALIRSGRFWGYALTMAFSTSAFYAFLSGVPLVAAQMGDLPPAKLGVYMGSITAGFLLGSFLSGRYAKRHALTTMMIAGRLTACAGLLTGVVLFLAVGVNALTLFGATIFVGIGNGLTTPSASAGAVSVRPDLAGSASGIAGALTVGAGALLTSVTGSILPPENGAFALIGVMLLSSVMALGATVAVLLLDRRDPADASAG